MRDKNKKLKKCVNKIYVNYKDTFKCLCNCSLPFVITFKSNYKK